MTLEVLTGNERAISLYKEEGFDPDSDERTKRETSSSITASGWTVRAAKNNGAENRRSAREAI